MYLGKFLLNGLQPLMPLAVSDLGLRRRWLLKPVFLVQPLNLADLGTETRYLFPKNL